jgi:two-component sensor histidine kinase
LITISLTVSPVKDAEGKIVGASKIARDISEPKRNQEQIVTLAREAEHRSKNILAAVLALTKLSQSDTPEGLKQAIEGRIRALANVHSLFVESRWIGAELSAVATQELAPYAEEARVRIDGPQVLLEPGTAHPPVTEPTGQGFGGRVIDRMIGDLKGKTRFDWHPEGLVCEISLQT